MATAMATKGKEKKCFVIGPIGEEGSPARTDADWLLQGIVKPALENDPFNYNVQRADQISEPGLITDQIIGAVIEADLVVADLSGANPNAFYELAIAHMEERAVIHMVQKGQPLPFDIKDYRAVFYSREHPRDLEEAKATLRKQVEAVEDPAYEPSNPITKARGVLELARTGDPRDKIVADLIERQRRLEKLVDSLDSRTPGLGRTPPPVDSQYLQPYLRSTVGIQGPFSVPFTDVSAGGIDPSKGKGLLDPYLTAGAPRSPEEEDDGS